MASTEDVKGSWFDKPQAGRLRYVGTYGKWFMTNTSVSCTLVAGANQHVEIRTYKNGSWTGISGRREIQANADIGSVSMGGSVFLAQNDYLETYIANRDGTNNIEIVTYNLGASASQ